MSLSMEICLRHLKNISCWLSQLLRVKGCSGSRVSCSGRNYSGKNVQGEKSREILPWREFHEGQLSRVRNYSGVIIQRAKMQRIIFLGRILQEEVVWGVVFQGGYPGVKFGVQLPWNNFMGSNCPRGSCLGGNMRIP